MSSTRSLFHAFLWGISIALSWMWGLGLFFSVQFTYAFGLSGLLTFAIPNALGLVLFGWVTHRIAHRAQGSESLANFFANWSRPFRFVFYLYQILALTLTIFAIVRYFWQPLGLEPQALYLPLTVLIVLAAGCLFGEEFNIRRIKYSHGALFLILLGAIFYLLFGHDANQIPDRLEKEVIFDFNYWGYVIPLCIGLLLGPWLDLQHWQRAIQAHRENTSVFLSYLIGGTIFFLLLLFHGYMTYTVTQAVSLSEINSLIHQGAFDKMDYAQGMLTTFFFKQIETAPWLFVAYSLFICICILTTLDSGYIALRWFLQSAVGSSKNALLSLVPQNLLTSPIPSMCLASMIALAAVLIRLELEYFMIFYATFFVGYAALGVSRCFQVSQGTALPQVKMLCIGSLAVVIFAYGYFLRLPIFQIIGSVLPLAYILWLLLKPTAASEFVTDTEELEALAPSSGAPIITSAQHSTDTGAHAAAHSAHSSTSSAAGSSSESKLSPASWATRALEAIHPKLASSSGHFEGKWFVHRFIATYADTNSVGNVYFGMYAMWVGKTRELFFHKCLPHFNLKTTPYYILTRSFEHKFLRETHEFEEVEIRIRVSKFNRKFATLEHEIYDSHGVLLGKGEQSLMFVASSDYKLIDIPPEVLQGFLPHT